MANKNTPLMCLPIIDITIWFSLVTDSVHLPVLSAALQLKGDGHAHVAHIVASLVSSRDVRAMSSHPAMVAWDLGTLWLGDLECCCMSYFHDLVHDHAHNFRKKVWCFDVRENVHRGVKTDASTRLIPVHPHLIELGILDLRNSQDLLFADLYRKTVGGPLGECIAYNWRKMLEERLSADDLPKRCFHSFRHSVIDLLEGMDEVRDGTIKAIIGHTPDSITSKVYGSDATPEAMLKAIERLPQVF